jgi:hypothetical protein
MGFIQRFRGILLVLAVIISVAATAAALSAFAGDGIEDQVTEDGVAQRVRTEGERCAVPLMEGWAWRPASWTLVSPNGTIVGFFETLHGRPLYTEWDEMIDETLSRYDDREEFEIIRNDEYVRIDFGENGGLSVIQKFDRVGCHLTFSPRSSEIRAQEIDVWEELIESVERTYPQE